MKPLVSIVIPTFNRARDLRRALQSAIDQSFAGWEAVVVDNHSTDDTDNVVGSFGDARIRLLKVRNEGVIAVSRNLGIANSRGEYIAFLDSDDWWAPRKLEISLEHLEQGADVVYHDMFLAMKNSQTVFWRKDRARELRSPVFQDLLMNGNALKNSSVLARRSILEQIGGLSEDPAMVAVEDFDAWLRAARITDRFARIPLTLGYYWAGGGNTGNPERTLRYLNAFEGLYAADVVKLQVEHGPWWVNYARARACYVSGRYIEARQALRKIRWCEVSVLIALKVLWTTSMIALFHKRNRGLIDT